MAKRVVETKRLASATPLLVSVAMAVAGLAFVGGQFNLFFANADRRGAPDVQAPPRLPPFGKFSMIKAARQPLLEPAPIASPIPAPATGPAAVAHAWQGISDRLRHLDPSDDAGLAELYAQARSIIQSDEKSFLSYLHGSLPRLVTASPTLSFFTVSAAVKYSRTPTSVVREIAHYHPPADPDDNDPHHHETSATAKHERLEALGLLQLRQQISTHQVQLSDIEKKALIQDIGTRLRTEPSINLSLEMSQLLTTLGATDAVRSALKDHSPRDRQLIQEALDSQGPTSAQGSG